MSLFNRINTSTPATPSLFGATNSQPQQTPSLFSSTATPAGGLFGGGGGGGASSSTPSTAAPASGGLFGAAPQQAPASTTGGGLFSPAPATAPAGGLFGGGGAAPAAGGLFGGAATATTSTPAAGGGLFGAAPAATTTAAGGGLFGGAATAATGGGLFGTPAQKPVGSSLFSPAPATGGNALQTGGGGGGFSLGSSTAQKPGLFGLGGQQQGQQQQQQQQQGQQQQQPGQQQQQQQNVIPAATVDVTRLTATTRFGDCHESVQMELEQLEKHIQDQIRAAQELSALFPRHRTTVESIPSDTKVLAHKLSTTKSFLAADQSTLQAAQQHHASDNDAATLSIRCLDLFRLPPQQRTQYFQRSEQENEVTSNGPMIAYFNGHAAAMDKKLRSFLESVGEVEASLRSVEQQAAVGASGAWVNREDLAGGAGGRQDAMKLNRTLREFNDALKDVSGRIVDVKDGLRELKAGGKR